MRSSRMSTTTHFTPLAVIGCTYGEYAMRRSPPNADITPHSRSAQSLGRKGLPSPVSPWITNSTISAAAASDMAAIIAAHTLLRS